MQEQFTPSVFLTAHTFTHHRGSHWGTAGRLKQIGIRPISLHFCLNRQPVSLFVLGRTSLEFCSATRSYFEASVVSFGMHFGKPAHGCGNGGSFCHNATVAVKRSFFSAQSFTVLCGQNKTEYAICILSFDHHVAQVTSLHIFLWQGEDDMKGYIRTGSFTLLGLVIKGATGCFALGLRRDLIDSHSLRWIRTYTQTCINC